MQQLCAEHFKRWGASHVFIQCLRQYDGHDACSQTASIDTTSVNPRATWILLQTPPSVMPKYDVFWAFPLGCPRLSLVRPTCMVSVERIDHLPHLRNTHFVTRLGPKQEHDFIGGMPQASCQLIICIVVFPVIQHWTTS